MPDHAAYFANPDLVACASYCHKPWRTWRWRAPRAWTCSCGQRYTREGRTWVRLMSERQLTRLHDELSGLP